MTKGSIPAELSKKFGLISNEVTWLHLKWRVFRQLYATSADRIEFLNSMAPIFFLVVEDSLRDDIILSFTRLTDPKESRGRRRLSIQWIPEHIDGGDHPRLLGQARDLVRRIEEHCRPFREIRDRMIGHLDLPTMLKTRPDPLPGINQDIIEGALSLFRKLLNLVEVYFTGTETGYEHTLGRGDGDDIVYYLEQFEARRIEEEKRMGLS